ncbi:hypothetical protein D3C84_1145640 [compost metagenome]
MPPVVIAVALVEDIGHAGLQGQLQGIAQIVDIRRGDIDVGGRVLLRVQHDVHFQALSDARAGRLCPFVKARATQGD